MNSKLEIYVIEINFFAVVCATEQRELNERNVQTTKSERARKREAHTHERGIKTVYSFVCVWGDTTFNLLYNS